MRVTNIMMSNQLLLNINRNMSRLDKLYKQQASGKQIMFPSENPILAGRILKFRTSVSETVQFQKNVKQGLSWMEITQGAYNNTIDILERIGEICNKGASDPSGTWEDRQKMVAELQGLVAQLGSSMNVNYAGRYVFSGYRTDIPPMFTESSSKKYQINQYFTVPDMEKTMSLQKTFNAVVIKGIDIDGGEILTEINGIVLATDPNAPTIVNRGMTDPDAYNPAPGTINFIEETGEYVLAYDLLNLNGTPSATYETNTSGGPVDVFPIFMYTAEPIVNNINVIKLPYTGIDVNSITIGIYNSSTAKPSADSATVAASLSTDWTGNIVAKTLSDPTAYAPGADEINYIAETGELILGSNIAAKVVGFQNSESMLVNYQKDGFKKEEPNPLVYFDCKDVDTNKIYTMDNQTLEFEFGISTQIQVNSLAKNTFTATMYAQLVKLCDFVSGITVSDSTKLREKFKEAYPNASESELDDKVTEQLTRENKLIETVLHDRFKNMIDLAQKYSSTVSYQETSLGVRMNRLTLIAKRLQQDYDTYKELLSDNEDADYFQVLTDISTAEAILTASYKTGANVMQLSLVNFI